MRYSLRTKLAELQEYGDLWLHSSEPTAHCRLRIKNWRLTCVQFNTLLDELGYRDYEKEKAWNAITHGLEFHVFHTRVKLIDNWSMKP